VTPTAPTIEQPCPILRRVRRSAKKSFHVSFACDTGGTPVAGCDDADDAFRTRALLGKVRWAIEALRVCDVLLERVHVENEAAAAERGAMMAGGWRPANVLAGHRALRASIVAVFEYGA
jgi:hypothetical protein